MGAQDEEMSSFADRVAELKGASTHYHPGSSVHSEERDIFVCHGRPGTPRTAIFFGHGSGTTPPQTPQGQKNYSRSRSATSSSRKGVPSQGVASGTPRARWNVNKGLSTPRGSQGQQG